MATQVPGSFGRNDIVKLNIGGHVFKTTALTLCVVRESMLGAMFGGDGFRVEKDPDDGAYFIDRDGTHFRHVLNYLRDGSIDLSAIPEPSLRELLIEAQYYQLPGLIASLRDALSPKPGPLHICTPSRPGDLAGLFYWLGTCCGTAPLAAEHLLEHLEVELDVEASQYWMGRPNSGVLDTLETAGRLNDVAKYSLANFKLAVMSPVARSDAGGCDLWRSAAPVTVEVKSYTIVPTHYSIRCPVVLCPMRPANWMLEGRREDGTWVVLSNHVNDDAFAEKRHVLFELGGGACAFPCTAFRISPTSFSRDWKNMTRKIRRGTEECTTLDGEEVFLRIKDIEHYGHDAYGGEPPLERFEFQYNDSTACFHFCNLEVYGCVAKKSDKPETPEEVEMTG
eukprot:TRINITY_DN2431_c0_g1_i1.p1 TRINITY_DN2431_c0_g1~~TRINITY_DN2431_c0_g1_i1.p1  ORF type:complete len:394 (+),score=55.55 TRINITY_DN2431_c0_g1_i1:698-1879(+)